MAVNETPWDDGEGPWIVRHPSGADGALADPDAEAEFAAQQVAGVPTRLQRSLELLRKASTRHRRLMERLVAAHEDERRSLSENLHDDTIQVISAVGMRLDALRGRIQDEEVVIELDKLQSVVRNAVRRLRHLVFELRPPELDQVGLLAALRLYLHENAEPEGPRYRLVDRLEHEPRGPTRLILYRFAQESLTNARKHARAGQVTVEIAGTADGYSLTVIDDGVGCSPDDALRPRPGHLGLAALRERAELSGGQLDVHSTPGVGTVVELQLPAG
jgi:signal transduction histidine kinase